MCETCQVSVVIALAIWFFLTIAKRDRRFWVNPFYLNRSNFGFENHLLPMILNSQSHEGDHVSFRSYFRISYESFQRLCEQLEPSLNQNLKSLREDNITVREKVAVTLRFLATGDSYRSLEALFLISSKTIQKIVIEVCDSIVDVLGPIHMKLPSTEAEWLEISRVFEMKKRLPHCLGALDGKHIKIARPPHGGSQYWCYKQFDSIVLLAIADAQSRFIWAECGIEGRFSDGGVLLRSEFKKYLDANNLNLPKDDEFPYFFIGDDAFPLSSTILKPFKGKLSAMQDHFNKVLCGARVIIENAFGILVARFRVLSKKMELLPENAKKVTMACVVLHNMMLDQRSEDPELSNWRDIATDLNLVHLQCSRASGNGTNRGINLREKLAKALWNLAGWN